MKKEKIINLFLDHYVSVYLLIFNVVLFFVIVFGVINLTDILMEDHVATSAGLPEKDPRDILLLCVNIYSVYLAFSFAVMIFDGFILLKNRFVARGLLSFFIASIFFLFLFFSYFVNLSSF